MIPVPDTTSVSLVFLRAFDANTGTFIMLSILMVIFIVMLVSGRLPATRAVTRDIALLDERIKDIAVLEARIIEIETNERKLKEANADLHKVVTLIAAQNSELSGRVKTLEEELRRTAEERDQLKQRNGHLEYMLNTLRPTAATSTADGVVNAPNRGLRDTLVKQFSTAELTSLCADLNVRYEDMEGDTKPAKAQGIIDYFQRHDELVTLIAAVKKMRPNAQVTHDF